MLWFVPRLSGREGAVLPVNPLPDPPTPIPAALVDVSCFGERKKTGTYI